MRYKRCAQGEVNPLVNTTPQHLHANNPHTSQALKRAKAEREAKQNLLQLHEDRHAQITKTAEPMRETEVDTHEKAANTTNETMHEAMNVESYNETTYKTSPPPTARPPPLPLSIMDVLSSLGLEKYCMLFIREDITETAVLVAMLALPGGKSEARTHTQQPHAPEHRPTHANPNRINRNSDARDPHRPRTQHRPSRVSDPPANKASNGQRAMRG